MRREPAVAGQFYPAEAGRLRAMIAECTPQVAEPRQALGALVPHAGYVFSGPTAGAVLARLEVPATVVVLHPSHHYRSPACALWSGGSWQTPLGEAAIHRELTEALASLPMITLDDRPLLPEHSAEVVVPFLQYHRPDLRMAVICITGSATPQQLKDLGAGIAGALEQCGERDALVVASSDMSHEQGPNALQVVNRNDPLAIERMEALDPDGLIEVCRRRRITMCGVLPAAAMMACVRARGGTHGELVQRATSADSPHGRGNYVVGYAGMIFA